MRLLDLFCGAGGAAKGYQRAGFYVVGVDIKPQPHYCGDEFYQVDAMTYPLEGFDAIHASPPCQKFSTMRRGLWKNRDHPDLIALTRERLLAACVPFVIENVEGARRELREPTLLCGTMFGLGVGGSQLRRHRYFETSFTLWPPATCAHNRAPTVPVYGGGQDHDYHPRRRPRTIGVWGHAGGASERDGLVQFGTAVRREAMGIDWMTGNELSQAIPPAYTEYIGRELMKILVQEVRTESESSFTSVSYSPKDTAASISRGRVLTAKGRGPELKPRPSSKSKLKTNRG